MKVFIVAALVTIAAAAPQQYPKPAYPAGDYPKADYKPATYKQTYDHAPMPYQFAWAVKDDYTYSDYAHEQVTDDKGYTKGSYRVLLPDGRVQTVSYTSDAYNGYVAGVQYSGEAKYPEYKPAYKAAYPATTAYPAPAYKAAPAYPTPAYPAPAYAPKY